MSVFARLARGAKVDPVQVGPKCGRLPMRSDGCSDGLHWLLWRNGR